MSQISVEKLVDAPIDQIWSILADFGGIHRFHPAVERSPIVNGVASGVGAQRTCHFYDGTSVTEEVRAQAEGASMQVAIIEGSLPLDDILADISVEAVGAKTRVRFDFDYEPRFGPVGKLMNAAMIRPKFRKLLGQVLDSLEIHAKTGQLIGKDGVVAAAAA